MAMDNETKYYKTFIITLSLTVALCLSAIFLGIAIKTKDLLFDTLITTGRAYFNNVVMTRKWNAHYGGVYVIKTEDMESNPYLKNPDIEAKDGRILTLKNPAIMTREVSEIASNNDKYTFHITSKKLRNPHNRPDAFESQSLDLFEKGQKEAYTETVKNGKTYFRYMAPLTVVEDCLKCHSDQGYKVGDIRGGISITIDIEDSRKKLRYNILIITTIAITTTVILLALMWVYTRKLFANIHEARRQIEHMAITDGLTGGYNRRYTLLRFEEEFSRARRLRKGLGCIMLDIDHFKSINDKHGHQTGDVVIREIFARMKRSVRLYDICGRYGGEEFLTVVQDVGFEDMKIIAEKIRMTVKGEKIEGLDVTTSVGISTLRPTDHSIDDIIKRADEGLYIAKGEGRDRVCWVEESHQQNDGGFI